MPAATVNVLRDFETQFDALLAAILDVFSHSPYSVQLAGHNTTDVLITPRLEYDFALNEPAGPEGSNLVRPTTGAQIGFTGTLTFRLVYDHTKLLPPAVAAIRGALRTLLSPETAAITSANLPHLAVGALSELSAVRGRYRDEKEKLLTEWMSTWGITFQIREEAWPA